MATLPHLLLDATLNQSPLRNITSQVANSLPAAKETKQHPTRLESKTNASIFFVGTATTILEWEGIRLMTDPNFLHAGDHVHLGPGVSGTRRTNPALDLDELPRIDVVLLSHYHGDHFDQDVEAQLRRNLPIITTPHAKSHLENKGEGEAFTDVWELDAWNSMMIDISSPEKGEQKVPAIKVTGMPGKHVSGTIEVLNDFIKAIPPTNGWMVELGYQASVGSEETFKSSYRFYISGDTLMVDELKKIPEVYKDQQIDLMLIHLGGTTIPSPHLPLLMVTMDAKQGLQLLRLIQPDVTIPIHYDDYDVFLSPLSDFKREVEEAGLSDKVVYLERKDKYEFVVKSN
ncbi:Metallo-hydrolase/oxidoreductase [Stipitochalara longipes BDJ]|nr:Metallo-hydrolase/oxidoreductase [Stipitochalara longipes BDJ]